MVNGDARFAPVGRHLAGFAQSRRHVGAPQTALRFGIVRHPGYDLAIGADGVHIITHGQLRAAKGLISIHVTWNGGDKITRRD